MTIGVLTYKCSKCGKTVTISYRPGRDNDEKYFLASLFDQKKCKKCAEK